MIACTRCGKENQDHYKFCLGCGAEIAAKPAGVGMLNTMAADSAPPKPTPPAGMPEVVMPPAAAPPSVQMSTPPSTPASATRQCPQCDASVPASFKFCGSCGGGLSEQPAGPAPAPVAAAPQGKLTLIRPDGSEGGTHDLQPGTNLLGRSHGGVFETDGYLSPDHAELMLQDRDCVIRDLDSLNGIFVRMMDEEELEPGQIIRIGQELIRFDLIEAPAPLDDGTEIMGSPNPGYWGKLTVIIGNGVDGSAFPLLGDSATIGRERGDINFPDDGYISGLHARVSTRDGRVFLADMGSSNGTFLRVAGERPITAGSFLLLGQQLFRLSLS